MNPGGTGRPPKRPFAAHAPRGIVVLSLVVALAGGADAARGATPADLRDGLSHRLSSTKALIASAREREQTLQTVIAVQSDRIARAQPRVDRLAGEVGRLETHLTRAHAAVRATEARLTRLRAELGFLRRQLRLATTRLDRRLVDAYSSDEPTALEVFVGASNLGDAIDQVDFASRIMREDASLVAQVAGARRDVARARVRYKELRRRQAALAAMARSAYLTRRGVLDTMTAERDRLAALRATRSRWLASIRVQRSDWEAEAAALEAESARLAEIIRSARDSTAAASEPARPAAAALPGDQHQPAPDTGGQSPQGLAWPVRGTIVSPFGQRWGRLHAGIDIAAPAGTPIVAAAPGSVVYAGVLSGYGLLVVVQHARGVATAYAHNSSIAVQVGQSVGQGQTIAAVGCTGHCFGDHVHFEVRVGGNPVDPMSYL